MSRFFWVANVLFRLSCNSPLSLPELRESCAVFASFNNLPNVYVFPASLQKTHSGRQITVPQYISDIKDGGCFSMEFQFFHLNP